MQTFDAIVLGLGTMGSFTCLELARRGLRVAGFDALCPPHSRGSHSGDTRVFRVAYAEHPDYVPLAQRAGLLWDRYGAEFGKRLLTRAGMLSVGPADGAFLDGIRNSARIHHLEIDELSADEIQQRYPVFAVPEASQGIFEKAAGWLDVPASIEGAQRAAERMGAAIFRNTPVVRWTQRGSAVAVETADQTIEAPRLAITAGAGARSLLRDLQLPLTIERKTLTWIEPRDPRMFAPEVFPVFTLSDDFFYGFPNIDNQGVKLAIHWRREQVIDDPFTPVRPACNEDFEPVIRMANRYLPGLTDSLPDGLSRVRRGATCLYTMTPDEHFIVDQHPEHGNVWFAAGFSGHGFKFAPAIGEALADLCTEGKTSLPIQFLRAGKRFVA